MGVGWQRLLGGRCFRFDEEEDLRGAAKVRGRMVGEGMEEVQMRQKEEGGGGGG